jgi:hypothetical protein
LMHARVALASLDVQTFLRWGDAQGTRCEGDLLASLVVSLVVGSA